MKKFSFIPSNTAKNIYNNTSINAQNSKDDKIDKIIETRNLIKKDLVLKSIQKRKKIKEKFIPKKDNFYLSYREYAKFKKEQKDKEYNKKYKKEQNEEKSNDKRKEEKIVPLRNIIFQFQNKLNNTNSLLKNISEENKMFHDRYKLSFLGQKKEKNNINLDLSEKTANFTFNDFYKNNVFNQSILLNKQRRIPDYILKSLDYNESKEDLKIIQSLKKHFNKGQKIEYPEFLTKNDDESIKLFQNISQMKKEIKILEDNISKYEKNRDFDNDFDLTMDKRKELNLINQKISSFQSSKAKNNLNINYSNQKNSDKINNSKLLLSSEDIKGEYKLVTKCIINNKLSPINKNKLSKTFYKNNKIRDFNSDYNKTKDLISFSTKNKFKSGIINYNSFFKDKNRKTKRNILKSKYLFNKKKLDSLSSCLESFVEKNVKEKDINKLYSFMKKGNNSKISELLTFYKDKYGKKYEPENIQNNIQKHFEKYNIVKRIYELDELDNMTNGKDKKERKNMLNNIKVLDEKLENEGMRFMKRILDFN